METTTEEVRNEQGPVAALPDVGERLERLDNSLGLAERRLEADLAPAKDRLAPVRDAELERLDSTVDQVQEKAADLRDHGASIGARAGAVGAAAGDSWRETTSHAQAELDELRIKADTARRNEEKA